MGALMLSCDIEHPDSEKFIDIKMETSKVTGANISVKVSNSFMEAAIEGKTYNKTFNGKFIREDEAKPLFDKLIHNSWKSAEPGILFWDKALSESPARGYGERWKEKSTNPLTN